MTLTLEFCHDGAVAGHGAATHEEVEGAARLGVGVDICGFEGDPVAGVDVGEVAEPLLAVQDVAEIHSVGREIGEDVRVLQFEAEQEGGGASTSGWPAATAASRSR